MAQVTITNNLSSTYLVPAPIRRSLDPGETKVFDFVLISEMQESTSFINAVTSGAITISITDDFDDIWGISTDLVGTTSLEDGAVITAKLDDLAVTTAKLDDAAVTTDKIGALAVDTAQLAANAVESAKMKIFLSAVIVADGTAQSTAHSLGATPNLVLVVPVDGHNGIGASGDLWPAITEGSHDATDVIVTVTNGASYRVLALV